MSRRTQASKRAVPPDVRYNNVTVQEFINRMMRGGKKSVATRVLYRAFGLVEARTKRNPLEIFEEAVKNVRPLIEVKPRRVGGATYQVPMEVPEKRSQALAMRWMLAAAHSRPGKSMAEKLAAEFIDAAQNQGAAIKRREDTHKMAEANRAFAHFRW